MSNNGDIWTEESLKKDLELEEANRPTEDTVTPPETDQQVVKRLVQLSPMDYDRQREEEAKKLGVKVSALDRQVDMARKEINNHGDELVEDVEGWHETVDAASLLNEYRATLNRYCILPKEADVALALWSLASFCINNFRVFPKACLSSPEKRCGKTTTLETLEALTSKAIMASNVTPSVIFRLVEQCQPSLLIDEGDTFINQNEELRGIINSGHTKKSAFILRTEGEGANRQPKRFSTWAPMVIAMIKTPPDTIIDRSIMITLRRKMPEESVQKLPLDLEEECLTLRQKALRWAQDNASNLSSSKPDIPCLGNDRAEDNWTPLLAIADSAGGDWPRLARSAMKAIESNKQDDDSIGPELLNDIRSAFEDQCGSKLYSEELVNSLVCMEERPWSEWKKGYPMTKTSLAKLLKPYGIKSKQFRIGNCNKRGYELNQFNDAFSRYLPNTPTQSVTTLQTNEYGASSQFQSVTQSKAVTLQKPLQPNEYGACNTVTLQNGGKGVNERDSECIQENEDWEAEL